MRVTRQPPKRNAPKEIVDDLRTLLICEGCPNPNIYLDKSGWTIEQLRYVMQGNEFVLYVTAKGMPEHLIESPPSK